MTQIHTLVIESTEKSGIAQLIQYGVEYPDGKTIWNKEVGEAQVAVVNGGNFAHLTEAAKKTYTKPWSSVIESWESALRSSGIVIDENTVRPKPVQRIVLVAVGEAQDL